MKSIKSNVITYNESDMVVPNHCLLFSGSKNHSLAHMLHMFNLYHVSHADATLLGTL